jgi:hypothetical protein
MASASAERCVGEGVGCALGGAVRRRRRPLRASQLPVLEIVDGALVRLALLLPIPVDIGVREDPIQPRLEVGPLRESAPRGERLHERVLHEIGGVLGVARHAHGRAVELVHERQGLLLELRPRTGWGEIDVVHLWPHYAEFIDEPLGVVGDARR